MNLILIKCFKKFYKEKIAGLMKVLVGLLNQSSISILTLQFLDQYLDVLT